MKKRNIPFGYEIRNGEIVTSKDESLAVRMIFREYLAGASLKGLAEKLNGARLPYSAASPVWSKSTVKRVLDNVRYTGLFGCPMLVAPADYDAAAAMKSENRKWDGVKKITPPERRVPPPERDFTLEIMKLKNEFRRELDRPRIDAGRARGLLLSIAALKYDEYRLGE
ncbi:MAG: recombinase family protein [Oscillospiraceae bacterium]|jgi:hypothetical protein|nr:recombinase family protein [Oscillospiraceae bacterium]